MKETLEGVRRDDLRERPVSTNGVACELARRGQVAYWRDPCPLDAPTPVEGPDRRRCARSRARLRSGKILDGANAFLCECRIHDVSAHGVRLALARNLALPPRFLVHDDDGGVVRLVALVWRRGLNVGARWAGAAPTKPMRASQKLALQGRYYAVPD